MVGWEHPQIKRLFTGVDGGSARYLCDYLNPIGWSSSGFTAHYPACRRSLGMCVDLLSSWAMLTSQTLFLCTYPQFLFLICYMKAVMFSSPPSRWGPCKYRERTSSRTYLLRGVCALCKVQLRSGLSVKLKTLKNLLIFSKEELLHVK